MTGLDLKPINKFDIKNQSKHQRESFIQCICPSSVCFTSYFLFGRKLGDSTVICQKKKKKKQRLEGKIMIIIIIILLLALKIYHPNSVTDTWMYLWDRDKCVCCMHLPLAVLRTQGGLYWSTLWWVRYWHLSVLEIHRTQHQGGWKLINPTQGIQDLSIRDTLSPSPLRVTCCGLKVGSATHGKVQIWWYSFLYIQ